MNQLDPALLEILVCPRCRGDLKQQAEPQALICDNCRLVYPIREGIPILLIDEAKPIPAET